MGASTLTKKLSINQQVSEWLRNNPGKNLKDAKKALNVTKDLKIKSGNLTDKRSKITVSDAKGSREASRNRARWLRKSNQHLTKEQKDEAKRIRAQAKEERKALLERLKKGEISQEEYDRQRSETDHLNEVATTGKHLDDLDELLEQGKITQEQYNKHRKKLEDLGIGDSKENLINVPGAENRKKATEVGVVQKRLGEMEKENRSDTLDEERYSRFIDLYRNTSLLKSAVHYSVKYGKPVINWGIKAFYASQLLH